MNAGRDLYRQAPSRVLSLSAELRQTKRNSSQDSLVGKSFIIHNCSLSSPTRVDNDQLGSSNSRETPTTTLAECPYRNDSSSIRDDNRSKIWESSAYNDRASLSLRETSYRNRSSSTYAARNAPESNFTIHSGALPSSTDTEDYLKYFGDDKRSVSSASDSSYRSDPSSLSRTRTVAGNSAIDGSPLPSPTDAGDDHFNDSGSNGTAVSTRGGSSYVESGTRGNSRRGFSIPSRPLPPLLGTHNGHLKNSRRSGSYETQTSTPGGIGNRSDPSFAYRTRNAPGNSVTSHSGRLPSSTYTEDYQDYSCSNEAQASTGSEPSYHDGPSSSSRTRTAPGNNLIVNNYTINYGSLPTATVTNDDHLENSDGNGRWASTHGGNCPAPVSRTQTIPGNGLTIYNNNTINGSPFPSPTGADDDYRYFEASRGNGTVVSTLGESSYRNGSCSLSRTRHAPQRNFTVRSRPLSAPSATSGNHLERLCNNASPSTPEEISNRNGPSSTTCTRSVSNLAAPAEPSGPRSSDAELEAALVEFDNRQREREPIGNAEELEAALVN